MRITRKLTEEASILHPSTVILHANDKGERVEKHLQRIATRVHTPALPSHRWKPPSLHRPRACIRWQRCRAAPTMTAQVLVMMLQGAQVFAITMLLCAEIGNNPMRSFARVRAF